MPSALDPGDRKLLMIAGAILLVLLVVSAVLAPSSDAEGEGTPTTYSTARNGAQAAYLLLNELGYQSERWEKSPAELPPDGDGRILILAEPSSFPDKSERNDLDRFARSGGWILYAGDYPFLFFGTGEAEPPSLAKRTSLTPDTFPAIAPSRMTRDSPEITMLRASRWVRPEGAQISLYGSASQPVVLTWRLGKGRAIWWGSPTPLTNSGITRQGNLPFFLDCIQAVRPNAIPRNTTVLWDEYFHGYRGSLWSYFQETPVPWAIFQLGVLAILVFIAFGRRNGPVYAPARVSRLSPLEFVDTLGDLYRRANAGPAAVRVAYQRFRSQILRRLALSHSASNVQLDSAVRERMGWKQPGLFDTLQRAESAGRANEFSSAEALSLVQALEHYEALLGLKKRPPEEKR